jgi:hypothetical protein
MIMMMIVTIILVLIRRVLALILLIFFIVLVRGDLCLSDFLVIAICTRNSIKTLDDLDLISEFDAIVATLDPGCLGFRGGGLH